MEQETTIPPITIYRWPTLAVPDSEIRDSLTYLAYKVNKPVTFRQYSDDEGYSENSVSVRVAIADGCHRVTRTETLKVGEMKYSPSESQVSIDIDISVPEEKRILDDDSFVLAYVDHNRIIIPIELTAADNQQTRAILSHIVERAVDLLDFKMTGKLLEQRKKLAERFYETFAAGVQAKVSEHEENLRNSEREAQSAYFAILDFERRKPVIEKELRFLKKLQQIRKPRLFRNQAQELIELLASGQYSSIEAEEDGSIIAITSPVTIRYENYSFPMGSYEINIDSKGRLKMQALDEHPNADYPHPHINTDGRPCLGNIAGDIPKMIGSMRIAEALQVLYEFLCQYNPDNPYEKIGHFDPAGQYEDEDNPCENCDESCTPYCIQECGENDGQYSCSDCCDYRTDYCYQQCDYNRNGEVFSPCDECSEKGTEHCYLDCQYNDEWQLHKPCGEGCEFEECGSECSYFEKLESLKEVTTNADSG
jgi:hypothetical protein